MACSCLSGHIRPPKRVYFTLQRSGIKLVRPLSTVDNTRDYARVSHSRQCGLTITYSLCCLYCCCTARFVNDLFSCVFDDLRRNCGSEKADSYFTFLYFAVSQQLGLLDLNCTIERGNLFILQFYLLFIFNC